MHKDIKGNSKNSAAWESVIQCNSCQHILSRQDCDAQICQRPHRPSLTTLNTKCMKSSFSLTFSLQVMSYAAIVLLITLIGYYAFRHYYFNPLRPYPGPFTARISPLRNFYWAWSQNLHLDIRRCHEKYGVDLPAYQQVKLSSY